MRISPTALRVRRYWVNASIYMLGLQFATALGCNIDDRLVGQAEERMLHDAGEVSGSGGGTSIPAEPAVKDTTSEPASEMTGSVVHQAEDAGGDPSDPTPQIPTPQVPSCDKAQPFSTPVLMLDGIGSSSTEGGWMSRDGLTVYFDMARSDGLGAYDIYRATRDSLDELFGEPVALANVNSIGSDRFPWLSPDGLVLYFDSDRSPNASLDIMVSTRSSLTAEFGVASRVDGINADGRDDVGSLSRDGRTLYFSSARTGNDDIYATSLNPAGAFGEARPVAALNSDGSEANPVISADGLTIYFAREIVGLQNNSSIYAAHRTTENDGFGEAVALDSLNSDHIEFVTWVSDDECTMLLSSDRLRGNITYDLYWANRPPF